MKRSAALVLALTACFAAMRCSAQAGKRNPTQIAREIVTAFSKGDYAGVTRHFDATMKKALPPDKVKETWQQLQAQAGKFKAQGGARTDKIQGFDLVYVLTKFEKADLECKVVFDDKKQVAGLFFVPKGSK